MDKYFMWIHYERLHNHNKAKHNKTVYIFLGIYCRWLLNPWKEILSKNVLSRPCCNRHFQCSFNRVRICFYFMRKIDWAANPRLRKGHKGSQSMWLTWWCHDMGTLPILLALWEGNPPITIIPTKSRSNGFFNTFSMLCDSWYFLNENIQCITRNLPSGTSTKMIKRLSWERSSSNGWQTITHSFTYILEYRSYIMHVTQTTIS